jgi:uncharacterized protein YndB with AHSA1/START domain
MAARNELVITTPSDLEIAMTRDFDAPRALVWEVFTRPEHVRHWWGCKHLEVTICEIDLRVGGTYRYVGRMPDGTEVPFKGEFREIAAPERLVYTEIYDVPMARDHAGLVTTTFTEKAGKTTMHSVVRYDTKQTRDTVLASGMESGAAAGYDQIEVILAAQREKRSA